MKIVFIINSLLGGGAQRVISELCNYLCETHEVHLILLENKIDYKLDRKVNLHILNNHKINIIGSIIKLNKLWNELNKNNSIALFFSNLPKTDLIVKLSKVQNPIFVIHSIRSKSRISNTYISFLSKLKYQFIYKKQKLVSVSNSVKIDLINFFHFKSKNISVIYNPFNIKKIQYLGNENIDINDNYIIGVGTFSHIKRFDKLLEVFVRLLDTKKFSEFKLVLVGDGILKNKYKRIIEDYNIEDKVIFTGWVDNPYKYIKNARCLLVTSEHESFGNIVIESLILNTPVYSFKNFGPEEILKYLEANIKPTNDKNELIKNLLNIDSYTFCSEKLYDFDIERISNRYLNLGYN